MKITNLQRLKAFKKALRETTHSVKPIVNSDKKKANNKYFCRIKNKPNDKFD